jgi:CheY-like chemotaxis protein
MAARSERSIKVTTHPAESGRRIKPTPALRVLVMEDDAIIGVLLGEMLEGMGYDVCAIEATEADAVLAAARCRPDLMIVDVQLGEGSGVAAVDAIHRIGAVPHVFVSGNISSIRALRPDSISLQKPYRESELAMVIQQALRPHSVS